MVPFFKQFHWTRADTANSLLADTEWCIHKIHTLQIQTVFWWNKIYLDKRLLCECQPEEKKRKMGDIDEGDILDGSLQGKINLFATFHAVMAVSISILR